MACGLPVVATADPAYDEYELDSRGIAFVSAHPDMLRRTFLEILLDDRRRECMSAYSRELATKRFDWRNNAADLADLYGLAGPLGRRDVGAPVPAGLVDVAEHRW